MLSALGGHHGWPKAELEALTIDDLVFYCDALIALRKSMEPPP